LTGGNEKHHYSEYADEVFDNNFSWLSKQDKHHLEDFLKNGSVFINYDQFHTSFSGSDIQIMED
jgi:hypothetical protein